MGSATSQVPHVRLDGDIAIPQLGLGTFQITAHSALEVVEQALRAGYRHVDTAAAYANETEVGQAVRAAGLARGDVFLTTKCPNGDHGHRQARRALEASLRRLCTDYVDLYLIHWPVPARDRYVDTWKALIEAREEGLTHAIGVSNFQPAHLQRLIEETGVTPAVNQVELHPLLQQAHLRRTHVELGIVTQAWSPLAQGQALGQPTLAQIAARHARSVAQVVIRWHLQLGHVAIPKSAKPRRLEENLDVFDFQLDEGEMGAIAALDRGRRVGPDPDTFGS